MRVEEWELRQEEREIQESKECKEAEDKRMKISLAQILMGSGDAELQMAAKRKLLETLEGW